MVKQKSVPGLKLADLLRRRRVSLKSFVDQLGITTYELLLERCVRMGVQPPSQEEWNVVAPDPVNSPTEGVVVLEPPPIVKEDTGKILDPETWQPIPEEPKVSVEVIVEPGVIDERLPNPTGEHVWPSDGSTKKTKKRKFETPDE